MNNKTAIDVYSALHSPRGMGVYTINFLKELAKLDTTTNYIMYADKEDDKNVLPKQDNFTFKVLPANGLFHYEQIILPRECKKDKINILHSPANTSPIFLDKTIKRFLTLHDIIFLKKEVPFSKNKKQFIGRIYYIVTALLNAKKAEKIFTVSEFSKQDIMKTFHLKDDKFVLTPNGHEHFDNNYISQSVELKEKYGFTNKYYFTLGGDAPSKNTELLLNIFVKNKDKNLVVAGIKQLETSILYNKYKHYSNIKFVPYIEQSDLAVIYNNSEAFIFPSMYEGFGIPLLEAMKCNCPIICSNASCLPEVAGEAALYFNPKEQSELADKINEIENDKILREGLIKKGQNQLKQFSWKDTAKKILQAYKNSEV